MEMELDVTEGVDRNWSWKEPLESSVYVVKSIDEADHEMKAIHEVVVADDSILPEDM